MANTADTLAAGKIIEVTFTGSGADWNYSTDGGFDEMYVKSIIWHPSGADDVLVVNEGGVDGPSIVHWKAYTDLVSNGSFTANTTGWTAGSSALLASVAGGQSGNCLRITENGEASPYALQTLPTASISGKPHNLSFYVKQGTEATYRYYIYDNTNLAWIYQSSSAEAGATWGHINRPFYSPSGCVSLRVYFYQICDALAETNIYFDTVCVDELPINKQIDFGEKGVPLKPYIDIDDCTFSDITATKIIFILE